MRVCIVFTRLGYRRGVRLSARPFVWHMLQPYQNGAN